MTTVNLPSFSPAHLPEYASLTQRLESVGGRFRLAGVLRALGHYILLVAPLTVVVLFVAGFFTVPGWVHVSLIAIWVAAVVGGYFYLLHGPLFRQPSFAEIARLIEENADGRIPEHLNNALINAVLLAQEGDAVGRDGEGRAVAQAWIPHLLREVTAKIGPIPLEKMVPWKKPRQALALAAALLAACLVIVALAPNTFGHGMAVLLHPTRFVPQQGAVRILAVVPGNDTALLGQPLSFTVTVASPGNKTIDAQLQIRYASGRVSNLPMLPFGTENSQYNRQGVTATEDMDYIITAGDTQSERYHITVLPQIHLMQYALEIVPPAYTGQARESVKLTGIDAQGPRASVDVPMGSDVTLSVTLDGPAHEVLMDEAGKQPVSMSAEADGRTFSAHFPLRETLRYTLRVNDAANRTLHQFPDATDAAKDAAAPAAGDSFYTLTATPDVPPTVTVSEPGRNTDAKPDSKLAISATATDDYGITSMRLEIAKNNDADFQTLATASAPPLKGDAQANRSLTYHYVLDFPKEKYKLGDTLRYRVVATDNRDLTGLDPALGPQSAVSQTFTVSFDDKSVVAAQSTKVWEALRLKLTAMLELEIALRKQSANLVTGMSVADIRKFTMPIHDGQQTLKDQMTDVVKTFPFEPSMKLVQKSLEVLANEDATYAVDRGADILLLSDNRTLPPLAIKLRQNQGRIIDVLQTLLAIIAAEQDHIASTADHDGADLPEDARDAWKRLADDLNKFEPQQKAVIDATADLAKKPKAEFTPDDEKKLADLKAIEDQWEKFMNERLADMSRLAEQDQANASLLEEMVQMKVELAAAAGALNAKATQIAVPNEEAGLENATALTTHIERMLQQSPDRTQWQMEDPLSQNDPKMAELPKELQDMVGDLMDKEEDLTDQMESLASKFADSIDKGAGWDAADGPISDMSAQGVTGNQMPKDMEIQGRSGEGREGRSSGEMVGNTAEGKEGRQTPTRLTPDAFNNSQVDDKSTLPEGGATGGGKKAGVGTDGLEGPAPAPDPNLTQRLAGQQAAIRNEAERLALQMHSAQYDNFKLLESNAYLKKSEDALRQFHYQSAMYYQEKAVESLNTAKVLANGQIRVVADSSPAAAEQLQKEITAPPKGPLPKGYGEPVQAYFEKLSRESTQP